MEKEPIKSHEDLEVYKMAFDTAMKIFELSKKFPVEEKSGGSMEKTSICSRSVPEG
jgi:23S rRNA-intervening sequence protein